MGEATKQREEQESKGFILGVSRRKITKQREIESNQEV